MYMVKLCTSFLLWLYLPAVARCANSGTRYPVFVASAGGDPPCGKGTASYRRYHGLVGTYSRYSSRA